ncbi:hypothetical protein ACFQZR_19675 [Paenibacillus sp. GCM10027629]|uniref:hypothetical protein n=1 Tax=Paenibacillus sp. GCM10027629 TaxID=3273414 RepID=UPI0036323EF2
MNEDKLIPYGVLFAKQWFEEQGITYIRSFDQRYVVGNKDGLSYKIVVIPRDHKPGKSKQQGDPYESVMIDHKDYGDKTNSFFHKGDQNYIVLSRTYREGDRYFPEQAYYVLVSDEVVQAEFAKRVPKNINSKKTCNIGFKDKQLSKWRSIGVRYYRMNLELTSGKIYEGLEK